MDTLIGYFDRAKRPRIVIDIQYRNTVKEYDALIDSGADYSLLPKRAGLQLNMKPPTKASGHSTGGGGRVPMKHVVLETKLGQDKLKLKFALLYTCDDIPVIIGRKGIFDRYFIDFRQKENKIVFKKVR